MAVISLASILRNPKYFYRPGRFDPERFLEENSGGRRLYTHLLFGVGPASYEGTLNFQLYDFAELEVLSFSQRLMQ